MSYDDYLRGKHDVGKTSHSSKDTYNYDYNRGKSEGERERREDNSRVDAIIRGNQRAAEAGAKWERDWANADTNTMSKEQKERIRPGGSGEQLPTFLATLLRQFSYSS